MRTLAEELLLFALDDEKGTTTWSSSGALPYALAGALLADLALLGRVHLAEKQKVVVLDGPPVDDDILDDALAIIENSKKQHDAKHWVTALHSKVKRLRDRLEERLVSQGILRKDEHRVLFLFPFERYPTADPSVERGLRDQVRVVFLENETPDARIVVLISLLKSCNLLDGLFSKEERSIVKDRAKAVIELQEAGATAGAAAKAAADAAAAIAAVIASTAAVTAATASSSS